MTIEPTVNDTIHMFVDSRYDDLSVHDVDIVFVQNTNDELFV